MKTIQILSPGVFGAVMCVDRALWLANFEMERAGLFVAPWQWFEPPAKLSIEQAFEWYDRISAHMEAMRSRLAKSDYTAFVNLNGPNFAFFQVDSAARELALAVIDDTGLKAPSLGDPHVCGGCVLKRMAGWPATISGGLNLLRESVK